jgi:hypothetical protein
VENQDENQNNVEVNDSKILNQDEIDSLLGYGSADDNGIQANGVQAILNSNMVSYERLPMLEVVFDSPHGHVTA